MMFFCVLSPHWVEKQPASSFNPVAALDVAD